MIDTAKIDIFRKSGEEILRKKWGRNIQKISYSKKVGKPSAYCIYVALAHKSKRKKKVFFCTN